MTTDIRKLNLALFRILSLFILALIVLLSCSKEEEQTDYFSEKFLDIWEPVQYVYTDCIDDGVDENYDTAEICDCSHLAKDDFTEVDITANNQLVMTKLVISVIEKFEYSYTFDEETKNILFDDNTENYTSIHWTEGGLMLEGLKNGCLATHRMTRK